MRAAIQGQRRLLPRLAAAPDLDSGALWTALQEELASAAQSPPPERRPWLRWWETLEGWEWLWRPVAVVGGAVAVVLVAALALLGGPQKVLVPLGVAPPPPAVSRSPEFFKDYSLIQHLDALENFDTVNAEPLDDAQASEQG